MNIFGQRPRAPPTLKSYVIYCCFCILLSCTVGLQTYLSKKTFKSVTFRADFEKKYLAFFQKCAYLIIYIYAYKLNN